LSKQPPHKIPEERLDSHVAKKAAYAVHAVRHLVSCSVLAGMIVSFTAVPRALWAQPFDIPEGFRVEAAPQAHEESEQWRTTVVIRPVDSAFSELSTIKLRDVLGKVEDPDAWLQERLTADLGDPSSTTALLDSPDSPFGDPAFDGLREAIPKVFSELKTLARKPLDFCDGPNTAYNASGPLHELYCVYQLGPFRQYLVLRLQQVADRWYFTELKAMNERRLRHLIAIANSFQLQR